jgi:hypothetical protein
MKKLISRFTMKCKCYNFTDKVSSKEVFDYVDKYGDEYMANHPFYPWSFRIKKTTTFKSE